MKIFRNGILWFFFTQALVSGLAFILWFVPSPFDRFFVPCHGVLYLALNSLLFLPVYLLAGFALGKLLRIDAGRNALLATFGVCAVLLTAPFVVALVLDDHSVWTLYIVADMPHWWVMRQLSTSVDYASPANLLFTVGPPAVFALGIWLQKIAFRKKYTQ
jgi:hypothetical protein